MAKESVSSPIHHRLRENGLRCRIIRMPRTLDKFFRPLHRHVHWDPCESFRWLVVVMAFAWGRPQAANFYR
jgi:hypothetical protein